MKKFLSILLILFVHSQVLANDWRTKKGEKIRGEFKVNKNMVLPLDPGEWLAIDKHSEIITHGIGVEGITFVQLKNDVPIKVKKGPTVIWKNTSSLIGGFDPELVAIFGSKFKYCKTSPKINIPKPERIFCIKPGPVIKIPSSLLPVFI